MKITTSQKKKTEDIKNLTIELIKNGYGSDMIGLTPESLVKLALKHAKHIYQSKEILDSLSDEEILA